MLFDDRIEQASSVEWAGKAGKLDWIGDYKPVIASFLFPEPRADSHPDFRYNSIIHRIIELG